MHACRSPRSRISRMFPQDTSAIIARPISMTGAVRTSFVARGKIPNYLNPHTIEIIKKLCYTAVSFSVTVSWGL
jgi:hypothetical protein